MINTEFKVGDIVKIINSQLTWGGESFHLGLCHIIEIEDDDNHKECYRVLRGNDPPDDYGIVYGCEIILTTTEEKFLYHIYGSNALKMMED